MNAKQQLKDAWRWVVDVIIAAPLLILVVLSQVTEFTIDLLQDLRECIGGTRR